MPESNNANKPLKLEVCQTLQPSHIAPALKKLRHKYQEFKVTLGYTAKLIKTRKSRRFRNPEDEQFFLAKS